MRRNCSRSEVLCVMNVFGVSGNGLQGLGLGKVYKEWGGGLEIMNFLLGVEQILASWQK